MSPERPASDHEMLSEIWDEVKKLKVALDEVLYRTASREEQDQKVREAAFYEAAEVLERIAEMSKERVDKARWNNVAGRIRALALAAPAASKPEAADKGDQ